jgi:putative transcriptional regulator
MPYIRPTTALLRNSVQRCRARRGMTQQQLAVSAGVSRLTILNVESGRHHPSILVAYRIAAALGVSVTELFQL